MPEEDDDWDKGMIAGAENKEGWKIRSERTLGGGGRRGGMATAGPVLQRWG